MRLKVSAFNKEKVLVGAFSEHWEIPQWIVDSFSPHLLDERGVPIPVSDGEAVLHLLPVDLQDEAEPVGALAAVPGREVAHDPRGGGVLRVLQQEVPVDRVLTRHRHELVGKPNLNNSQCQQKQQKNRIKVTTT